MTDIDRIDHEIRINSKGEKYGIIWMICSDGTELKLVMDPGKIADVAVELMAISMKANTIPDDKCIKDDGNDEYTIIC